MEAPLSYYGRPIIKEPVWKPEIPAYFFVGGLAGASATLSLAARLEGNQVLARRTLLVAAAGVTASPYFLIKDLGRPARFYNILRVFKVTSPMSVGTWVLSAEGTSAGLAGALEVFGLLPRVKLAAQTVAGLLGPAMASYTGALVSDSVVPAWHEGRRELPSVFVGSACASAGGAASVLTPARLAGPARRLAVFGGALELLASKRMEKRLGKLLAEPYHEGEAGRYTRLADGCTVAGTALMAVAGRRRAGAVAAGGLLLAGSWCKRFAVYHAGKTSALDPTYTSLPQRTRAEERGRSAVTR
jgi:polysulfide reductase-like protein